MIDRLKELHAQGADVVGTGTSAVIITVGLGVGAVLGNELSQKLGIDNGFIMVLGGLTGGAISRTTLRVLGGIKKEKSMNI